MEVAFERWILIHMDIEGGEGVALGPRALFHAELEGALALWVVGSISYGGRRDWRS